MSAIFERGDKEHPRGHAILYFRSSTENEEVWATYLVTLPISVDVAKYVPPFLSAQIGNLDSKDLSAFAFPPGPEKLEGYHEVTSLAELRDDDVLYGGVIDTQDMTSLLYMVNDAIREYAHSYTEAATQRASALEEDRRLEGRLQEQGYQDVIYSLMSDNDRLAELGKLVGKLRYAVDGKDRALAEETEGEIRVLSKHLPENSKTEAIIDAAKSAGERGNRLAEMYIQRCYLIAREEYRALGELDEKIEGLESPEDTD